MSEHRVPLEELVQICAPLTLLRNFPWQPEALTALARMVQGLVKSDGEAVWLVDHMIGHYDEWPGPRELRLAYERKFTRPEDRRPPGACEAHWVHDCPICARAGAPARARE